MIQRCAKQDTKKKLSPKDALDIVKGVYKGMKDLSFFSMYPRTLDQRPEKRQFPGQDRTALKRIFSSLPSLWFVTTMRGTTSKLKRELVPG
jgi:hypothetical protein